MLKFFWKEQRSYAQYSMHVRLRMELLLTDRSPIPEASEKTASLRRRYQRLATSIDHYEKRVAEQAVQLNRMNRPRDFDDDADHEGMFAAQQAPLEDMQFTEEDMRREEEEVKELERKRRILEERVSAMEKDISGVMG